jgi:hypothetical protein
MLAASPTDEAAEPVNVDSLHFSGSPQAKVAITAQRKKRRTGKIDRAW